MEMLGSILGFLVVGLLLFCISFIKTDDEQSKNNEYNKSYSNEGYWYNGKYYSNNSAYNETNAEEPREYPYIKRQLLTNTEYEFYKVLKAGCDFVGVIVCPKVRMEDFLEVTDKKNLYKYRGYIKSRHIDFIICRRDLTMIAGIELDDSSHNMEKAQKIDEFKNKVFQTINTPLFRVKVTGGSYNEKVAGILNSLGYFKREQNIT